MFRVYVFKIAVCVAGYGVRGLFDFEDLSVPDCEFLRLAQLPRLREGLPQLHLLAG